MKTLLVFLIGFICNPAIAAKPIILFTGTDLTSLNEIKESQITISIVATDPDGINSLIGGVLLDSNGATYGTLSAAAAEGTYTYTLNWKAINRVAPINAPKLGQLKRLIVRLYDQSGDFTDAPIDINLKCSNSAMSACGGSCVDLDYDTNHCGACGKSLQPHSYPVPNPQNLTAVCRPMGPQFFYKVNFLKQTGCEEVCRGIGLTCGGFTRSENPYEKQESSFYNMCTLANCSGEYWVTGRSTSAPLNSCNESPGAIMGCYCQK